MIESFKIFDTGREIGGAFKFSNDLPDVEFLAEKVVDGETLIIKDLAIFTNRTYGNELAKQFGTEAILIALDKLKAFVLKQGFKNLRIIAERVEGSSSAKSGKLIDITIKLSSQ